MYKAEVAKITYDNVANAKLKIRGNKSYRTRDVIMDSIEECKTRMEMPP